jgi:hypothetical protein
MHGSNEKRKVDDSEELSENGEHSYYYDDAHGYEDFDPEEEDEVEPDEED